MKLAITDQSLPRYHLLGTLIVVLTLALSLGGGFMWMAQGEHLQVIQRLEKSFEVKKQERLRTEMAAAIGYLDFVHSRTETVLKNALQEKVGMAIQTAQGIYAREHGRRPEAEVKRLIIEALREQRFFDGRGYFFVDDQQGTCILLPIAPALEGSSLWDNRDDRGHYIMRGLVDAARSDTAGGLSRYRWYAPDDPRKMSDKLAFVRLFEPYGWVIGTGDYLYKWEEMRLQEGLDRLRAWSFGDTGRFMVMDDEGRILTPLRSADAGQPALEPAVTPQEKAARQRLLSLGRAGGGMAEFPWPGRTGGDQETRSAIVEPYAPWKIIVVASLVNEEMQAALASEKDSAAAALRARMPQFIGMTVVAAALALGASLFFSRWMSSLFRAYHARIDAHTRTLEKQAGELRLAGHVFESSREGIIITDPETRILAVNPAFTEITGFSPDDVLGRSPGVLRSGYHDPEFYESMWVAIRDTGSWSGEIYNRRKDGHVYPEQISISTVHGPDGEVRHYVGTFLDISERKEAEIRIRHLAEFDTLTQLPNRALLTDRLSQAIALSRRSGDKLAILFIDLDRFKNINDSLGHAMGDRILQEVAARLCLIVRESDTVSRLGGDEFVVLVTGLEQAGNAMPTAQKILASLGRPYQLDDHELQLTPSIGIAIYPDNGSDNESLLKNADAAMYHAKSSGRNNFQFFTPELNQWVTDRLRIENGLRHALEREEMQIHYQPQVDLASGRVVGCEALLRWYPAEGGPIPPDRFIPVAEETGLIHPIGLWVLDEACRQLAQWDAEGASEIRMAVNVAVPQLRRHTFVEQVKTILARHRLASGRLEIEVTESVFLDPDAQIRETLHKLTDMGVKLSLDDFGTGYSSLSYLKNFRFDVLKIDRSFVSELARSHDDMTLVRAISSIARDMSLITVAEGIESEEQQRILTELGCTLGQGYLFSRPIPASEFRRLVMPAS